MYYLWNTMRQGWQTRTGQTSTDLEMAEVFSEADALSRTANFHNTHDKSFRVVPVPKALLDQIPGEET